MGPVTGLSDRARSALRQGESLISLQNILLRRYFRLERAERMLARRARQARSGSRAIRQLELERQRLARELHTGVGQPFTAIRLQIEAIEMQLPDAPEQVRLGLQRVSALVRDALGQVRALSHRLQPPEWQRLTLGEALEQLWNLSGIPQRFEAQFSMEALPREPVLGVKVLAYRVAQEAFSNLAQHSGATRVEASLAARAGRLVLRVTDNGTGFDADQVISAPASLGSGIGLRAIREQAEGIGAQIDIQSGPTGTTLELSAPYFGSSPETADNKADAGIPSDDGNSGR